MPDEHPPLTSKPRGHWKEQDGDAWSLMLANGYYQIRGNDGSWFVEEHRSYFGNEPTLCYAWGEEFDAKEEAMVAVEEEILSSATFDLQQIGLQPLGEVIEEILRGQGEVSAAIEIQNHEDGIITACLSIEFEGEEPRHVLVQPDFDAAQTTADAAVRDVAAKLGEARP